MSRPLAAVIFLLLFLTVPAWAENHRIELKDADTENTTVDKVLHPQPNTGFNGDVHWDLEFDQSSTVALSETAFVHDKYPVNGVPGYKSFFNVETNETTVGKQFCLEYLGCAQADGDTIGGCNRPVGTGGYVIWTVPQTGNNFATTFTTAMGTTDTITHADGLGTPCTLSVGSDCAHAKVIYRLRLNNNLAGCTNPSTNKLRATWMETVTSP